MTEFEQKLFRRYVGDMEKRAFAGKAIRFARSNIGKFMKRFDTPFAPVYTKPPKHQLALPAPKGMQGDRWDISSVVPPGAKPPKGMFKDEATAAISPKKPKIPTGVKLFGGGALLGGGAVTYHNARKNALNQPYGGYLR